MMQRVRRGAIVLVALAALIGSSTALSSAKIDMSTGLRYVSQTGALADCSLKAKTALDAYLQGAAEKTAGDGEWLAFGPRDSSGLASSAAVVRCYALAAGYVATFTCSADLPGSPYSANDLCYDIFHNFTGAATAPLATPTPVPTGCSTTNLVGTWVSDSDSSTTLTMDDAGNLTDNSGVSGNWALKGDHATLIYYGQKSLTLSPDGKHLSGSGLSFTRKC